VLQAYRRCKVISIFSSQKIKFHIIHNYTSLNKGWASIVLSTVESIKKTIPNAEFTIESYHPNIDKKLYERYGIKVLERLTYSKTIAINMFLRALFWRIWSKHAPSTRRFLESKRLAIYYDSDVILDLAGDNLSVPSDDQNMFFRIQRNFLAIIGHIYLFLLCMLLKKTIVIYGQTIGPLGILRPVVKMLLNKMNLITVREENSLRYLEKIGVSKPPIYLTADPAFLLSTPPVAEISKILQTEGVNAEKPVIGMCISSETAKYHFRDGEQKFIELLVTTIDDLVAKYNSQVVLIPFSTWKGHGGDDRIISQKIYALTKRKEGIKLIKGEYNPIELKGIISRCNIFIGSRGHSCILALSSCVPTIAIGHNPKYYGIMKMVGQEHYVCKAQELTYDRLISLICRLWSDQETVKRQLRSKIRLVQRLATLNAELVKNKLQERNFVN